MFIAALFTIAKTWKQPKYPSVDEWLKKMWCVCVCVCSKSERLFHKISIVIFWVVKIWATFILFFTFLAISNYSTININYLCNIKATILKSFIFLLKNNKLQIQRENDHFYPFNKLHLLRLFKFKIWDNSSHNELNFALLLSIAIHYWK